MTANMDPSASPRSPDGGSAVADPRRPCKLSRGWELFSSSFSGAFMLLPLLFPLLLLFSFSPFFPFLIFFSTSLSTYPFLSIIPRSECHVQGSCKSNAQFVIINAISRYQYELQFIHYLKCWCECIIHISMIACL